jgi:hypothetical protein
MPKTGNVFPRDRNAYASEIGNALKRELGGTHRAVKTVMRWTGAGERTVKNWLAGQIGPSGIHLIALIRHSDAVLETVLSSADRTQVIASITVVQARSVLTEALARINLLLAGVDRP